MDSHGDLVLQGLVSCHAQGQQIRFFNPPTTHLIANVEGLTTILEVTKEIEESEEHGDYAIPEANLEHSHAELKATGKPIQDDPIK